MKKLVVSVVVAAVALIGADAAMAAIANTKHDLSSTSTASIHSSNTELSVCQYCHTPHLLTYDAVKGAPLWNRSISDDTSWATAGGGTNYTVYGASSSGVDGKTLSGTIVGKPGATSKTCLSCHDGTLSLGNVLVGKDSAGATFTDLDNHIDAEAKLDAGNALIGIDLNEEHPVGFTVKTDKTAGLPVDLTTIPLARFYGDSKNQMECGTCHDPHESTFKKFLRLNPATICLDCHQTK